jgi:hypothetical protein
MRVLVECYGKNRDGARKLFSEVRNVLLPPINQTTATTAP